MSVAASTASFVAWAIVWSSRLSVGSVVTSKKAHNTVYTWGYDPYYHQLYLEKFVQFDPFTTGQFFFDLEELVSVADLMPREEHQKSRFYKEWVQPQGWIDAIGATLEKSATTYSAFSVIRHERNGITDDETRRRMRLVVSHVRRAVAIGKIVDLRTVEAAALADTLDGLTAAMFLVDDDGRIVHANAAGHVMLADGSMINAAGGKLIFAEQAINASFVGVGTEDTAAGAKNACLPLRARNGAITSSTSSRSQAETAGRRVLPILPLQRCSSARLNLNCLIRWKRSPSAMGLPRRRCEHCLRSSKSAAGPMWRTCSAFLRPR